jgi:hypothetical protein
MRHHPRFLSGSTLASLAFKWISSADIFSGALSSVSLPHGDMLQPSARVEAQETSLTKPDRRYQVSTFERSLASSITDAHAPHPPAVSTSPPDDSESCGRQGEPQDGGNDDMTVDGEEEGSETQCSGHAGATYIESPSEASMPDDSDHNMDTTPDDATKPSARTPPPLTKPVNTPSHTRSPITRRRKRRRLHSSSENSDEGDSPAESESNGGTVGDSGSNPIDVDLYVSMWQPTIATEFVSTFHSLVFGIASHSFGR